MQAKKSIGIEAPAEAAQVKLLTEKTADLMTLKSDLENVVAGEPDGLDERAMYEHEAVIPAMEAARKVADELERRWTRSIGACRHMRICCSMFKA